MSDYLADDQPIDEAGFTRLACDPRRSVVVEACAGSGKTWLLVSRVLRLLLAGAAPGEILAITFTRRAAQEMRERLLRELKALAGCDDAQALRALEQRGLSSDEARAALPRARGLYEQVLTARVPLTMETFHGWFWQLVSQAPLGADVPFAPALLESVDRLRIDAWLKFSAALLQPVHAVERAAWERLIDELGNVSARNLLMQLLERRAEWWSYAGDDEAAAIERALQRYGDLGADDCADPAAECRDAAFVADVRELVGLWGGLPVQPTLTKSITRGERWLDGPAQETGRDPATANARDLDDACHLLLTAEFTPTQFMLPEKLGRKFATPELQARYAGVHARVMQTLLRARERCAIRRAARIDRAGLVAGRLLIDTYQREKVRQRAVDFTDLEWYAARLLSDDANAAYLQARLDARYRHVLLDEFQDTNPLQWQALQAWLAAYGPREGAEDGAREGAGTDDRPTVFVVGDPKQSIYRFRRADPRIFDAARDELRASHDAVHLRTNVTRRNAAVLIEVLNRVMPAANRLYQPQSTRAPSAEGSGFVWLPLAEGSVAAADEADEAADDDTDAPALRDVLTTPRAAAESDRHYREGWLLANEIAAARATLRVPVDSGTRAARWSDVLLLVRRRSHLPDYERALRDAGVPFISDRSGGLLATLEADDLLALLTFLTSPRDDLRLAHALRSPLFDCSDDDLITLAQAGAAGTSWWQRLVAADAVSPTLTRARELLGVWLGSAGVLPVHDLLDRIYHEGDLRRRYAASVPTSLHAQVQANLDAFIELALDIDAGRYPSLPRFIDELAIMRRHASDEAPDEGLAASDDAVRLMTIHGAKGLEAPIVALADAHARAPADGESVLIDWPPREPRPALLSLVARGAAARDAVRAPLFDDDDAQREQEDGNLLYVAATRAAQVLVVSGSQGRTKVEGSWYSRFESAADLSRGAAPPASIGADAAPRGVRDLRPVPLPTGVRREVPVDTEAQRIGRAWHALLEQGATASVDAVVRAHSLDDDSARDVVAAAQRLRAAYPRIFDADGLPELELVGQDGELLRVDRLVEFEDELLIVDFKWSVGDAQRPLYEAQVRRYAEVLRAIRGDKPVKMALLTAAGERIDVD